MAGNRVAANSQNEPISTPVPNSDMMTATTPPPPARTAAHRGRLERRQMLTAKTTNPIGFNDVAQLDDGDMWPTAFAIIEWIDAVEERVEALITKAVG